MEQTQPFSRLTVITDKTRSKEVLAELRTLGVHHVQIETGRSVLLLQLSGLKKLFGSGQGIQEDTVSSFSFLVQGTQEEAVIHYLTSALSLDMPGNGSVFGKKVDLVQSVLQKPETLNVPASSSTVIAKHLVGITCITQKGEANEVAQIGLNTGTAVPTVTLGRGLGVRNRMGLWRILVPAEKEVTTVAVDENDADTVLDMMVGAGKLDQPGKGFVYSYPLSMGVLNTKFFAGNTQQAASVEQIVSVIDEIKGSTDWRKKALSVEGAQPRTQNLITGIMDITITCNEGTADTFTTVAMNNGAGGATVSLAKHVPLVESEDSVSPAREIISMTLKPDGLASMHAALQEAGLFEAEAAGEILTNQVTKAVTYLG